MTPHLTSLGQSAGRIVALLVLFTTSFSQSMNIATTFTDPENHPFQQLVVHQVSGDVYVGATNRLHRLSSGLTLLQSVDVGPQEVIPKCPPSPLPCSLGAHLRDSTTKGLAVDYNDDTLLVCSTLGHGSCWKVAFDNVTKAVRVFDKPLVPDTEPASCVLFLGPSLGGQQAVYIGAEVSSDWSKVHSNLIPSISSRDLTDLNLVFKDKDGGTQKFIKNDFRSLYNVQYIHGFVHGGFVYFMTVQKESRNSNKVVSGISRVCTQDKYFRSFVEIPFLCEDSMKEYHVLESVGVSEISNKRMYAVFGDSTGKLWNEKSGSSVLCVVDLDVVDREFNRTVQECYAGSGHVGPLHYGDVRPCKRMQGEVDMCGVPKQRSERSFSLQGERPVVARAVWELPTGQRATAVHVEETTGQSVSTTMAFVGTAGGELVKVALQGQSGHEVDRLAVDSERPVVQIQASATSSGSLYVLSSSKVSYVRTVTCEENLGCEQCVASSDPQCGWCAGQSRCTTRSSCEPPSFASPHWLAATTGATCVPRTEVSKAPVLSYETVQSALADHQIIFRLEGASEHPGSSLDLACLFSVGGAEYRTAAAITREVIRCPLPQGHYLPSLADEAQDSVLRFHVHGKSIVTRSVSALGCGLHSDCGSCTNSSLQCQWCFATGTCVQKSQPCSSSSSSSSVSAITTPGSCPLVWMSSRDKEILVHAGGTRSVAVQVRNLQGLQSQDIRCHFYYLGSKTTVQGSLSSQSLTCDSVKFDYPDKEQLPYVTAEFQVSWGPDSLPLDNSQGIQVRIYKCSRLVTNCGKCLSMDPEYECGWCRDQCSLQKHCPKGDWLDRTDTCPDPQILRFSPTSGPIKGRSTISVTGLNLGKAYTDIKGGVQVAGVNCEVNPQHYEPSSEFVCETDITEQERMGTVMVRVDNKYTALSDSNFSFVDPQVLRLVPKAGPRSGGTSVMVVGTHMDAGSDVSVTFAGGNCRVVKRNHTMVECLSPKQSGSDDEAEVKVNFGGHEKTSPKVFTYANDPIITMIEPKISILSGGTTITIIGMDLDLIQKPQFFVTYGGQFFSEPCHVENTLSMECPMPSLMSALSKAGLTVTDSGPLELHYGFSLDGVTALKNVSHEPNFGPLLLYPDPVLHNFPGHDRTKVFSGEELLVVNGDFHRISQLMGSVSVRVGREECQGVAATESDLSCQPPSSTPKGTDPSGRAPVMVYIGNLARKVGYLRYYYNDLTNGGEDKPLTLGIVLGVVIPIIAIGILLTVCVLKRHRKHRPSTNYIPDVLQDYQDQPQAEEEMMGLTQVTVVDVNGQALNEEDCGPYVTELLGLVEDAPERQKILTTLIPYNNLHLGPLVGQGHFGSVYQAQLQGPEGKSTAVSVKALQAKNRDKDSMVRFLQEMTGLKALQHPRLMPIVGVSVAASSDPLVVGPLVSAPDLRTYLRDASKELTVGQLLGFGQQIADAMTFLQDVHVVHRNLAARNCVVGEDGEVRVGDYAMTQHLFPPSHHQHAGDGDSSPLLRWLAPECLDNEGPVFTSMSDVWAFGVVLWELLTRGITPYPDLQSGGLLPYLQKGSRLTRPKHCPESVFRLMTTCWNASPDQRPDFRHLRQQLAQQTIPTTTSSDAATSSLLKQPVPVTASTECLPLIQ